MNNEETPPQRRILVFDAAAPKYVHLLSRLCELKNWKPAHWFGSLPEQGKLIRELFPDVVYHNKKDVKRRRLPDSVPYREWPKRDIDVIRKLAVHDPVLYPVFLREARRPYGMDQLAEYHKILTTWYHFFEYVNPDLVVFSQIPAHVYDFLPYLLCRERDIPMLMLLKPYHVPGVLMPSNCYEEPAPRIAGFYRELVETGLYRQIELADEWQRFLDRMSGKYEEVAYEDFRRRYVINHKTDRVKLRDTIPRKLISIMTGHCKNYASRRNVIKEILTLPRRWRLRRAYESRTVNPDYDSPYIFVPLHVQPERTSIPQGDIFGHQLLMVELLSRTLPEGWMLYVKEHPVQLYDRPVHKFFPSPDFYKELLRFDNVRLVPSRITARKLIDHARAVAAVTSTACWEGLFQGKPALLFGHEWYNFCDGVFHTPTLEKCREAMAAIQAGYTVDRDKLKACLYAVQEEGHHLKNMAGNDPEAREQAWMAWTDRISTQIAADGTVIGPEPADSRVPNV